MKKYLLILAAIGFFSVTLSSASAATMSNNGAATTSKNGDVYTCVELEGELICKKVKKWFAKNHISNAAKDYHGIINYWCRDGRLLNRMFHHEIFFLYYYVYSLFFKYLHSTGCNAIWQQGMSTRLYWALLSYRWALLLLLSARILSFQACVIIDSTIMLNYSRHYAVWYRSEAVNEPSQSGGNCRGTTLLPVDDLLVVVREFIKPDMVRSGLSCCWHVIRLTVCKIFTQNNLKPLGRSS